MARIELKIRQSSRKITISLFRLSHAPSSAPFLSENPGNRAANPVNRVPFYIMELLRMFKQFTVDQVRVLEGLNPFYIMELLRIQFAEESL